MKRFFAAILVVLFVILCFPFILLSVFIVFLYALCKSIYEVVTKGQEVNILNDNIETKEGGEA